MRKFVRRSGSGPTLPAQGFFAQGHWAAAFGAPLVLSLFACAPGETRDDSVTVIRPGLPDAGPPDEGTGGQRPVHTPTESDLGLIEAEPPPSCGDGALNLDERCDDGNKAGGDGCSANCLVVEQGYACATPNAPCALAEICGDALIIGGETCDDGNDLGDDGCSANCQLEADFACPDPGEPCVSTVVCGDGLPSGSETCDDGNTLSDDGCSATCESEVGWLCPVPGALCVPVCGDGLVRGLEQCDDGGTTPNDGCSASCGRENGFACPEAGQPCTRTVCGDNRTEGSEGCDDGPGDVPFDGCFQCVKEPQCVAGECGAVCGDGLRYNTEECDDGNVLDGDGCSSTCSRELGYQCADVGGDGATGNTFVLPVIYRDFIGTDTSGDGLELARDAARNAADVRQHPDFNSFQGTGLLGVVQNQLGPNGLPVFTCQNLAAAACTQIATNFSGAAAFNQWYLNVDGVNLPIVDSLTLGAQNGGSFVFDSTLDLTSLDGQFDPLLNRGWQAPQVVGNAAPTVYEGQESCDVNEIPANDPNGGTPRNMSFTTESRFVFEYAGGEVFEFSGDDDVWVFINNRLVMDLGGLHEEADGAFTLGGAANEGIATITREGPDNSELTLAAAITINTGMELGKVYEVALFHAERHECGSNFKLTLAGFDKPRSVCNEFCGDGERTRSETCDDGPLNGSGYGACAADCTPGPRCGDAIVNGDEQCDNGVNLDRYSVSPDACGPGCTLPATCGDNIVNAAFGEQCDNGVNDNAYNGCSATCELGPRCGDAIVNGDEECDDGNRINGDKCNLACLIEQDIIPT